MVLLSSAYGISYCSQSLCPPTRLTVSQYDAIHAIRDLHILFIGDSSFLKDVYESVVDIVSGGRASSIEIDDIVTVGAAQLYFELVEESGQPTSSTYPVDLIVALSWTTEMNLTRYSSPILQIESGSSSCNGHITSSDVMFKSVIPESFFVEGSCSLVTYSDDSLDRMLANGILLALPEILPTPQTSTSTVFGLVIFFSPFILVVLCFEIAKFTRFLHNSVTHFLARRKFQYKDDLESDVSTDLENIEMHGSHSLDNSESGGVLELHPSRSAMDLYNGSRNLLVSTCMVALVLLLCFLAKNGDIFDYRVRDHSVLSFVFITVSFILLGFLRVSTNQTPAGEIALLSRAQTDEWKGIMQVGFLLYHYFHVTEVYTLIRVFIGAYVWLTGYGNYCYFRTKQDFSFNRVVWMFYRINLFAVFLCLTMDTDYMLYYICALHTFNFMIVYLTLVPVKAYSNNAAAVSIAMSFLLLTVVFQVDQIWDNFMKPLRFLYTENSLHEWKFRSTLDHYSVVFGMMTACALPYWRKVQLYLDANSKLKTAVACGLVLAFVVYSATLLPLDKYTYNSLHPYISWVMILAYIGLRNLFPGIRNKYMQPLTWVGQVTLETYLLQFHIWLSHDAKYVLTLIHEYSMLNFMLISLIFVLAARVVFLASHAIMEYLAPKKASLPTLLRRNAVLWGYLGFTLAISSRVFA